MEGKTTKTIGSVSTKSTGSSRHMQRESKGSEAITATAPPEISGSSQTATATLPQQQIERLIRTLKADAEPSLILALMGIVPTPISTPTDGNTFTVTLSRELLEKMIRILKPETDPSMVLALSGVDFTPPSIGTTDIQEPEDERISEADEVRVEEPGEEIEHPSKDMQVGEESTHEVGEQSPNQEIVREEISRDEGNAVEHEERRGETGAEPARSLEEEREQPLLTPEEVMENLALQNAECVETERSVEGVSFTEFRGAEMAEEATAGSPEGRKVDTLAVVEQETEQTLSPEVVVRTRDSPVRIYQRRTARETTSGRASVEEQQMEPSTQREEVVVISPEKSGAGSSRRKKRTLKLSESEEEEDDVIFTPLDELPRTDPQAMQAETKSIDEVRKERKRKGKALATPKKKKPRKASSTLVIHEGGQRSREAEEEEEEARRRERRSKRRNDRPRSASDQGSDVARKQMAMMQFNLDSNLLGRMIIFDDPKLTTDCAERVKGGKKVRSGRRLSLDALGELEATEGFLEFITGIGFDWLLEPSSPQMPLELAQEFFTTFYFTGSTDIGEESISFRIFTREVRMSIREWSVRLGLHTADQEVEWFGRDIGPPRDIPEFDVQEAWKGMVPQGTNPFQPTDSTADCLEDPILRLAQVFLAVNLLGQANTLASLTEAELYFMWCMMRKRKVHLGYWLARICHSIASNANRNLNTCHILGALFTNCIRVTMEGRIHKMTYCPTPELFGKQFLLNTGVLVQRGGVVRFYRTTQPGEEPEGAKKKKKSARRHGRVSGAIAGGDTQLRIEATPTTEHAQGENIAPSTSAAPHTSLLGPVDWRGRMEELLERIALNTERIALSSEAQAQMLTAQIDIQRAHHEDVRASVLAVREMVSHMARELVPQVQRQVHLPTQSASSRQPAGDDDTHPRRTDSRRDRPS